MSQNEHPSAQRRDLVTVDVELVRAVLRRKRHTDPASRAGNSKTIDALLDERLTLKGR